MSETRRLPSFNDFSPKIIGDLRRPLEIVKEANGNRDETVRGFATAFFDGKQNKRSSVNIPATLRHTGLVDEEMKLTPLGERVAAAESAQEAAQVFAHAMILEANGHVLLEAVQNLCARGFTGRWKLGLKRELQRLGIQDLARATTDHTTLANWLVAAGVFEQLSRGRGYSVNDDGLRAVIGISSDEYTELLSLDEAQRRFLHDLRLQAEISGGGPIAVSPMLTGLLTAFPDLFPEDQFRADVARPLEEAGWLESSGLTDGRGAKSGKVLATAKLLRVPLDLILKDVDAGIPPDLRVRLNTPLDDIKSLMDSDKKYDRGLGFELLTLRMLLDLSLQPTGFRKRSKETAYAEIDALAEGTHLVFSRWTIQCKCTPGSLVDLSDVAKEVGIALHQKAHVVMVVTTGRFTTDALAYADQVARDQYFQFLLLDGKVVQRYLKGGRKPLLKYVISNAERVMERKAPQRRRK